VKNRNCTQADLSSDPSYVKADYHFSDLKFLLSRFYFLSLRGLVSSVGVHRTKENALFLLLDAAHSADGAGGRERAGRGWDRGGYPDTFISEIFYVFLGHARENCPVT